MAKEMMKRFQDAYDYLYHNGSINSKTDLAKIMGAGRTSISYAYNGRPEYLNEKFLIKFSNAFPGVFNIDWLLTGDGEMLKKAQEDTKSNGVTNSSDENISRLLEQNKELIDVLKKSLEESLELIIAYILSWHRSKGISCWQSPCVRISLHQGTCIQGQ